MDNNLIKAYVNLINYQQKIIDDHLGDSQGTSKGVEVCYKCEKFDEISRKLAEKTVKTDQLEIEVANLKAKLASYEIKKEMDQCSSLVRGTAREPSG